MEKELSETISPGKAVGKQFCLLHSVGVVGVLEAAREVSHGSVPESFWWGGVYCSCR